MARRNTPLTILKSMSECEGHNANKIAMIVKMPHQQVYPALKLLQEHGFVRPEKRARDTVWRKV